MRKHNLISLIYANLEKTSTAVEEGRANKCKSSNADARLPLRPMGRPLRSWSRSTAQTRAELLSFTSKIERSQNGV